MRGLLKNTLVAEGKNIPWIGAGSRGRENGSKNMNGSDLIATAPDFRTVEATAHACTSQKGKYSALSICEYTL